MKIIWITATITIPPSVHHPNALPHLYLPHSLLRSISGPGRGPGFRTEHMASGYRAMEGEKRRDKRGQGRRGRAIWPKAGRENA